MQSCSLCAYLLCTFDRAMVIDSSLIALLFMWMSHVTTGERKTFLLKNENKIVNHKANSRKIWGHVS